MTKVFSRLSVFCSLILLFIFRPRILTQNGHLVFQSGTNHNITFRATAGGYINVNGDDLAVITQTVSDHYENLPMQYTEIFSDVKNENFTGKL